MRAGTNHYQAAATTDVVVTDKPALLHGIIIGADVGSSVIEVSDSKDDGDGNIKIKLSGSELMTSTGGYVSIGSIFQKGITADITLQTDVTFIYSNVGLG